MELVVDSFAGGGGASLGIERALGRAVDIAINHDPVALEIHRLNHPETRHFVEDIFEVDPVSACGGRPVGLLWASPDCKHFSRAKGGRPVEKGIRSLAWVVVRWAAKVRPRVIILENVSEFMSWGPLGPDGRPCRRRSGRTFREWVANLERLGYAVEWRELVAADYGAPTTRKRLFLVARCDGAPIVWPEPTHGPGRGRPYRTAAECIDWTLPCPSIFERKRPLAENTLRRIAEGIRRYVLEAAEPFIVTYYGPKREEDFRGRGIHEPLATVVTENRHGIVVPHVVKCNHQGERFRGQDVEEPLRTVCSTNDKAVVTAFLAKHYGGVVGHDMGRPLGTVTGVDHHSLVTAHLTKFYGTNVGADMGEPMPTVTAEGWHLGEVRAFLVKYYGTAVAAGLGEPLDTVTTRDRFGLVTVRGEDYVIADIGLRMLQPRELARAQGFPDSYVLVGTKTAQVAAVGNSVPPPLAEAMVRANVRLAEAGVGAASTWSLPRPRGVASPQIRNRRTRA